MKARLDRHARREKSTPCPHCNTAAEREAEVERLRATVARVEALLAEYERMCQPAPYTSERALVERLRAALEGDR